MRRRWILFSVFLCFIFAGAGYARWRDVTTISTRITSGKLQTEFSENHSVSIYFETDGKKDKNCKIKRCTRISDETMAVSFVFPKKMTLKEFEKKKLIIEVPINFGKETTVQTVKINENENITMQPKIIMLTQKDKKRILDADEISQFPKIEWSGKSSFVEKKEGIYIRHCLTLVKNEKKDSMIPKKIKLKNPGFSGKGIVTAEYEFVIPFEIMQKGGL